MKIGNGFEMKKVMKGLLWGMMVFPILAFSGDFSRGAWIDLTHAFSEASVYWPVSRTFEKTTVFEGDTDKGHYYSAYDFQAAEHGGTHMDAPVHFYKGRNAVHEVPIEQLIGEAAVMDISRQVEKDRDYQFSVQDILAWEKEHGRLPDGVILLINTGLARFYPERKQYMGTDKRGQAGVDELSFPGIHPKAARFLTTQRNIKAVGLDTPSIDYGKSKRFESHVILCDKNVPGFENVANLDKLPAKGATVFALPMKIKGGSGAPLRIVAFVPDPA
uniref:Kynurenine formamidase n=1 Tax=Candidatus Kentrum sp. MB TaxID=2138164 RepID=A0A451B7Y4_9GAMM|nr:MAG: Kynurenine formamidase [Candidatus Kentron sp. MB]VFK27672.1 MAG: Kynurenine formamidase [Candidatus Kentron sp. MB]VFK74384.1 MAG: Kynurenine formamidase [Candidatus Kentron sp. MB]